VTSSSKPSLETEYSLAEVAKSFGMSTRWVRDRIRFDGVEHQRYGHVIKFTAEQVAKFKASHRVAKTVEPVTTGPAKKSA
jgi:hypothetical protein